MMGLDRHDWALIERLQQGIPIVARPYEAIAADIGLTEAEVLARVRALASSGAIRRLGFRVRHQRAGVGGNIMVAWEVPEDRVEEVGRILAAQACVRHCYERPPFEGFPYNVYSMVHSATPEGAEEEVARLASELGGIGHVMLPTVRELKKASPRYVAPLSREGDEEEGAEQ